MSAAVGVFNRLCIAASSPGTVELPFLEGSTLGLNEQFIDSNFLMGTRGHQSERVRVGTRRVEGNLVLAPTPVELDTLLPYILGANGSGSGTVTYALAETVPSFYLGALRGGSLYNYTSCKVDTARFTASEGSPLQLALSVIGADETVTGSFPSLTADETGGPFTLMDCTVTIGGTGYAVGSFELSISNALEARYRNSATITQLVATDRIIELNLPLSLGDASALYGASNPVAVVATFTNGLRVLTFTFAAVQAPRQELPFGQRGILDLPWRGVARKTGSTLELVTTLHSANS